MSISVLVTLYFWLLLALLLLAVAKSALDSWRGIRDFGKVGMWLEALLRRGYAGGTLSLLHKPTGQSFRFRKYIRAKGDHGLELLVHNCDLLTSLIKWSKKIAEASGLPFRVEAAKTDDGFGDVLVVDCGKNTAAAYELGHSVWTEVFGLTTSTPFFAQRENLSAFDELIDDPEDQPPHSAAEKRKKFEERQLGPNGLTWRKYWFLNICYIVGLPALFAFPVSMLASRGDTPDWSIQLLSAELGGSTASLVFFLLLVCFLVQGLRLVNATSVDPDERQPIRKWTVRCMLAAMPIMTILAWSGY